MTHAAPHLTHAALPSRARCVSGSDVKDGFAVRGSGRACAALPWTGRHPAEVTHHACLGHSRRSRVRARHTTSTRPFIHRGANIIARADRSMAPRTPVLVGDILCHMARSHDMSPTACHATDDDGNENWGPRSSRCAPREDARRHRAGVVDVVRAGDVRPRVGCRSGARGRHRAG